MEHTGFPSEETLAAFIDGRLDDETRKRVVEHMAGCTECYETFLGAGEWAREVRRAPIQPPRSPSFWIAAIGSGVAASLLLIAAISPLRVWYGRRATDQGLAVLATVCRELPDRPIEGRLMGGFAYRPLQARMRGNDHDDSEHQAATAELSLIAAQNDRPGASAGQLHIVGCARLLVGDSKAAVRALGEAISQSTDSASISAAIVRSTDSLILNDLSAAYFERYLRLGDTSDLRTSIEASEKAWRLAHSPEAAWNRAIALEAAHSARSASAWANYLNVDANSLWASEAERHLERLRK